MSMCVCPKKRPFLGGFYGGTAFQIPNHRLGIHFGKANPPCHPFSGPKRNTAQAHQLRSSARASRFDLRGSRMAPGPKASLQRRGCQSPSPALRRRPRDRLEAWPLMVSSPNMTPTIPAIDPDIPENDPQIPGHGRSWVINPS